MFLKRLSGALLFGVLFAFIRWIYLEFTIDFLILSAVLENIFFFIIVFLFSFFTDRSRIDTQKKLNASLKTAVILTIVSFVLTVIKLVFSYLPVLTGTINLILTFLLGCAPLLRDRFIYEQDDPTFNLLNYFTPGIIIILKIVFTLIAIIFSITNHTGIVLMSGIFGILIFFIRPVILGLMMKGYIDYDGVEHPVFNRFRAGKTQKCDVVIDDSQAEKPVFFTVNAAKNWTITPSFEIKLENKPISSKAVLNDQDTINCRSHYFTVSLNRPGWLKRIVLLFTFLTASYSLFGSDPLREMNHLRLQNLSVERYPLIDCYVSFAEVRDPSTLLIIDRGKSVKVTALQTEDNPVDIIFVLDITGVLPEQYRKIRQKFRTFYQEISGKRKSVRMGLITFADLNNEMNLYQPTENPEQFYSYLDRIVPLSGNDYAENPYDALGLLEKIKFAPGAQKAVVLITDAPPHVKGDKMNKGKDFTNYTTEDMERFFNAPGWLLYVVSYGRFAEYQKIISGNSYKFFDIQKYDDFSEIFTSLTALIRDQAKITFQTVHSKGVYRSSERTDILFFSDQNSKLALKRFQAIKIKQISFFDSFFRF